MDCQKYRWAVHASFRASCNTSKSSVPCQAFVVRKSSAVWEGGAGLASQHSFYNRRERDTKFGCCSNNRVDRRDFAVDLNKEMINDLKKYNNSTNSNHSRKRTLFR
mmetsp:Transcript_1470/g.2344  ORF Transcript_1470/g.2344 Transcript_1470/m.2344 type:complete len:106 (+) Transcript_1470:1138-1455(+)